MIEQYMRDDDESDCESDLEESDLEHIVRKVFNNVCQSLRTFGSFAMVPNRAIQIKPHPRG